MRRLNVLPAPWTQFVPAQGATARVTRASVAAAVLFVYLLAFVSVATANEGGVVMVDVPPRPLALLLCQESVRRYMT